MSKFYHYHNHLKNYHLQVEIVVCKLHDNGKQLVKHRVKFLDETGVTPKFGVYDEFDVTSFFNDSTIYLPFSWKYIRCGYLINCMAKLSKSTIPSRRLRRNVCWLDQMARLTSMTIRSCSEELVWSRGRIWKRRSHVMEQNKNAQCSTSKLHLFLVH